MKTLLATTAMFLAFTNAHAGTEAQGFSAFAARQQEYRQEVKQEINEACARKWGTNYEMQLYCRTKQEDAFESYLRMMAKAVNWLETTTDSSARVWAGIISDCVNKWGSDVNFDMINYCVSKQTNAYNQLQMR